MTNAIAYLASIWRELTRPRGPIRHRFYRASRRSRSGIALLLVITSLLFMTVLVTEIAFAASLRQQLGAHQRDEAKAEALARSGLNIYRLLLVASKGLGNNPMIAQVETMLGIDLGDALWQMIPFINTGMMRMLFVSGGSVEGDELEAYEEEGLTDEQVAESREGSTIERNFLDFDGDFYAEVTDEDRKINVASFTATSFTELKEDPTAVQLHALMSGMRSCPSASLLTSSTVAADQEDLDQFFYERNLDRWDLISNLADWTDTDSVQMYRGGSEDNLYNTLERDPYLPKNTGFDTLEEIRLIEGWNRDDVWNRFGTNLTVYGTGKVNINTVECDVMWALLKSYIEPTPTDDQVYQLMVAIQEYMALTTFSSGQAFTSFLTSQGVQVKPTLTSVVTTESQVFRVTSTGQVNDSTVTLEAVIDFTSTQTGDIKYFRVK
jgi:type II secretory pathway component PulK